MVTPGGVQVVGMPFGMTEQTLSKSQLKRRKRKAKDKAKKVRAVHLALRFHLPMALGTRAAADL